MVVGEQEEKIVEFVDPYQIQVPVVVTIHQNSVDGATTGRANVMVMACCRPAERVCGSGKTDTTTGAPGGGPGVVGSSLPQARAAIQGQTNRSDGSEV